MIRIPKRSHTVHLLCMGVMLVAVSQANGDDGNAEDSAQTTNATDRSAWAVQSADQALANARSIVGLTERAADITTIVELVVLASDTTPFLNDRIIGRPLWRVTIEGWRARLKSAPDADHKYVRVFDVLLDPVNGRLLTIDSRWPEGERPVVKPPSAEEAVAQMRRSGGEVYHDFVPHAGKVTFLDALDAARGRPLKAKQISARLIIWSKGGWEPRPVWAITVRGVRNRAPKARGSGEERFQHRDLVDAESGKWIGGTNTPHGVVSEE